MSEATVAERGEELTDGGLGIAISRATADDLEIRSRHGVRDSRLRLAKRLLDAV
jgi:anti-sigma regulatory factor (Ser/Thr protein kinase)